MTGSERPLSGGYTVRARATRFTGAVFQVVTDTVAMPDGDLADRDYLRHPGSVAVVPFDERTGEVVLVRQYRHPVGGHLWELPAGLVDHDGETLPQVAHRELAEEVDLVAGRLDLLLDLHLSPGCSDEHIRIFLARQLTPAPRRHARVHEEAGMTAARFGLDEAVTMVTGGRVTNASAAAGLLATARARDLGWAPLRPVDTPAPAPR